MFRRLHRHHLRSINSATSSASELKSSSSSSILKFKLLPTRSTEIRQFRRNLSSSSSIPVSNHLYPELSHRSNFSSFSSSSSNSNFSDDPSYLRVDLYPGDNDPVLHSIHESTSMQQIFDIFTSLQENGTLNEKYSSQCLVTLWDHQKFMFSLGHLFDPSTPYMNRGHYIKILREHPVLQSIIEHIMANYKILEDGPLSACLLVQKRFNHSIRHPYCQKLIEELLQRKSTLGSAAISRLCVSLRNESLYGDLVLAELGPTLYNHANNMSSDSDIRNISIALRSSYRAQNSSVIKKYQERLSDIWHTESHLCSRLEPVTLCKIILLLHDSLPITMADFDDHNYNLNNNNNSKQILSSASLIRNYGNLLAPRVSEMTEMDIITLYKFILHRQDPVKLIEAISTRVFQLVELNPNLDIITCVQPKSMEQRIKLASFITDFIDTCTYFDKVSHLILRVLFKINYDREIFDKFWGRIADLILKQKSVSVSQINRDSESVGSNVKPGIVDDGNDNDNDSAEVDGERESRESVRDVDDDEEEPGDSRYRILLYTNEYLNFVHRTSNTYSYPPLESLMYQEVLQLLKDTDDNKIFLSPSGYAKCLSFVIYMNHSNIQHQWNPNFFKNFKIVDLLNIHKGLDLRWKRKDSYFISNAINKQAGDILRNGGRALNPFDYLGVAKLSVEFQRTFESCPNFLECVDKLVSIRWDDSRVMRDLMLLVLNTSYYCPKLFDRVSKFITEFSEDVPLFGAEKFVLASYVCCAEGLEGLPITAEIVKRNVESATPLALLQSMLSFSYHGCLDLELIHHVFDVGFLDAVDEQIKAFPAGINQPMKIREVFMELNRAVCIDKPEANVPWFHQKYCEQVASVYNSRETYLHREVGQVLSDIFDGHEFLAKNVYSPYHYFIDFLIQFDKNGDPLKPSRNGVPRQDAITKVAIFLNNPKDFTLNIRRLKGYHRMKTRHLEILGYQVIHIDPLVWNSMRMSERLAKNEYLESCIFKRSQLP